jgi:ankyrin repeat protein
MFARRDFTSADGASGASGALGVLADVATQAHEQRKAERVQQWRLYLACVDGDANAASAALGAGATLSCGAHAPLHAACANGHIDLVGALVDYAVVNADRHPDAFGPDDQGRTPLLVALASSQMDIARALLRAAGVNATTVLQTAHTMKLLLIAVVLAVLAITANAQPACEQFTRNLSSTAYSKIATLCNSGLQAWFCHCFDSGTQ